MARKTRPTIGIFQGRLKNKAVSRHTGTGSIPQTSQYRRVLDRSNRQAHSIWPMESVSDDRRYLDSPFGGFQCDNGRRPWAGCSGWGWQADHVASTPVRSMQSILTAQQVGNFGCIIHPTCPFLDFNAFTVQKPKIYLPGRPAKTGCPSFVICVSNWTASGNFLETPFDATTA